MEMKDKVFFIAKLDAISEILDDIEKRVDAIDPTASDGRDYDSITDCELSAMVQFLNITAADIKAMPVDRTWDWYRRFRGEI